MSAPVIALSYLAVKGIPYLTECQATDEQKTSAHPE
jgi:hypothetical protein